MASKNRLTILILFLLTLMIGAAVFLSFLLIHNSRELKSLEYDEAELNSIQYGFFDKEQWKQRLTAIVMKELKNALAPAKVNYAVYQLVDQRIDKFVYGLPDFNAGIYSRSRLHYDLEHSEIMTGITNFISGMVHELAARLDLNAEDIMDRLKNKEIFDSSSVDRIQELLDFYQCETVNECQTRLSAKINLANDRELLLSLILAGLILGAVLIYLILHRMLGFAGYLLAVVAAIVALVNGVFLPMINLDARILSLEMNLLGEKINYTNQVLFFQSKSIFDVFVLLVKHKDLSMIVVGLLIFLFSIITPLVKLISSLLIQAQVITSHWFQKFINHLGKWSMADVFTVSIFMAFLGMNGIINSNFSNLANKSGEAFINTANNTHGRAGLLFFILYTLIIIALSFFVKPSESKEPKS